jgi:hypothetical protein
MHYTVLINGKKNSNIGIYLLKLMIILIEFNLRVIKKVKTK